MTSTKSRAPVHGQLGRDRGSSPLVKEKLELMTMDINVVGAVTGSVFAAAAIVPFIVSALRTSLKKRRRADSQSAEVTRRWLVRGVE
jgi:hypothetical protein